ncbi:WYL domain-containing protein [Pseudophaeobacter sp.]|uniref:WYL domain-containing protein n=1 Tax=Pseudophaeobacter sp. TaxID=1971739 RepID=UPI003A97B3C4
MSRTFKPIITNLTYRDAAGAETDRAVTFLFQESRGGKIYLHGWCDLYNDARTFRLDRITGLTSEGGQVLETETLLGELETGSIDDIPDEFWEADEPDGFEVEALASDIEEENPLTKKTVEFYWGIAILHSGFIWYASGLGWAVVVLTFYCVLAFFVARWWNKRRKSS